MGTFFRISGSVLLLVCLLQGCFRIQGSEGGGQLDYQPSERRPDVDDVLLPDGYAIEIIAEDLTFPTGLAEDDEGVLYVVESGYSNGEVFSSPKLWKIEENGRRALWLEGERNGPWTGISFHDGDIYLSEGGQLEGGKVLRINRDGEMTVLTEDLPGFGDHHTTVPVVKNDYVYFGQGTATNSAVVGTDNSEWLMRNPEFHDIPCRDVVLNGINYTTNNPLTEKSGDKATTGAYMRFGEASSEGQVIKGRIPCTGAILRVPIKGGEPELVAWGLRNPFGLAFSPGGELYVTENGYDMRGSRPIWGTGDVLWKVEQDAWYGWPDYSSGFEISNIKIPGESPPKLLLAERPGEPPHPVAELGVHSSSTGLDFSRSDAFGYQGDIFIAQFGDMAPYVGKVTKPVGYKVVRVDVEGGVVEDFAVNKGKYNGPATWLRSGGLERPVSVKFSHDGKALYVVDFGIMTMSREGPQPVPRTGVIWKITRKME